MNNNHFSIKRYLEDEGFICDLYLFNTLPDHFLPINDTWKIEKHEGSIKKINRGIIFLDQFKRKDFFDFKQYDIYIGTGLTPYYFNKLGLKLDVFVPYGSDLYELPFKKPWNFHSLKSFFKTFHHNFFVYKGQKEGIIKANFVFTIDVEKLIKDSLLRLNRTNTPLQTPMVYLEKPPLKTDLDSYLDLKKINSFEFKIISHSRQLWGSNVGLHSKGSDKLIIGFSLFAKKNNKVCLVLFDYGPSVKKSKQLIDDLNISDQVIWVKQMPRKFIYALLKQYADVGADQFNSGFYGSTTYELMAHGLPVLNYINRSNEEFEKYSKRPLPPLINVKSPEQINDAFQLLFSNDEYRSAAGKQAKDYFNKYLGKGAAKVYVKEILKIHNNKKNEYL